MLAVRTWSKMNKLVLDNEKNRKVIETILSDDCAQYPPLYILSGSREIVLTGVENLIKKARAAGVIVEEKIYNEMLHGFLGYFQYVPECLNALQELVDWLTRINKQ